MADNGLRRADYVMLLVLVAGGLAYYLSYFDRGINLFDEGNLVEPAMRVLSGDTPYRDFDHVYAPGRFYFFALVFGVFGPSLVAERAAWAVIHLLSAILAFLAMRRISPPFPSLVSALVILIAPAVWHKGFFIFFPLLMLFIVFGYIDRPGRWRALGIGVACAAAFMFRQDLGIYCALSFTSLLLWMRLVEKRPGVALDAAYFLAGGITAVAPFLVYFQMRAGLDSVFWNLFVAGREGVRANALPFPPFFPLWSGSMAKTLSEKLFYLPFAIYGVAAVTLIAVRRSRIRGHMVFAMALGILILIQIKNRTDVPHLWQVIPPAMVMLAGISGLLGEKLGRAETPLAKAAPFLAILPVVLWTILVALGTQASGSIAMVKNNTHLLGMERAGVYVPEKLGAEIEAVLDRIREDTATGERFIAVPDIPMLYFLAGQKNPLRRGIMRMGLTSSEDAQREMINGIRGGNIGLVVLNRHEITDGRPERSFSAHSKLLYGYIMDNYESAYEGDNFTVMRLKHGHGGDAKDGDRS